MKQGMFHKKLLIITTAILITGCSSSGYIPSFDKSIGDITPNSTEKKLGEKICTILDSKPHWKDAVKETQNKWRVPPHVLLSIINQESSFKYNARPIKNGKRLSSAYRIFSSP